MSYLQDITADTNDARLNQLVQESLGDIWGTLNDLEQSQRLCEAYEYRQALSDQRAIDGLLAIQSRSSSSPNPFLPLPIHSPPRPRVDPFLVHSPSAMQSTTPRAESQSSASALTDDLASIDLMAEYTKKLFRHIVTCNDPSPHPKPAVPLRLPYFMIEDAQHVAELVGKAYGNQSKPSFATYLHVVDRLFSLRTPSITYI
jgi:hypothetical protein